MKPGKKSKETSMPKDNLLALFNRLTKLQTNEECMNCTTEMLQVLESSQPEVCPDDKSDKLEAYCSSDLCYAVRRLIKGCASINERTRRSFAAALCSVIAKFKDIIPCAIFVKEFNRLLTAQDLYGTANPSRSQETALNSARLACIGTTVEVYQELEEDAAAKMISELFAMAETRSFLGIPCFQVLLSIKKLGKHDLPLKNGLQTAKVSVDLIWFLHEAGIPKENVRALCTFVHEPILANSDMIFPLLNDSISYLSEPHKLWFSMLDFAKTNETVLEILERFDQEFVGSDSLQKKILGVKLMSYCLASLETLPLDKFSNLLQLINQLGPKHAKGSKNTLPLNQELSHLMTSLRLHFGSLSSEAVTALLRLSNLRMFPEEFKAEIFRDEKLVENYFAETLKAYSEADEVHKPMQFDSLIFIAKIPSLPESKKIEMNQQLMTLCFECIDGSSDSRLKQAMLTRFQTLMTDSLQNGELAATLQLATSVTSAAEFEDEVVEEGSEKIRKLLKKIESSKLKDSTAAILIEGFRLYLLIAQVWLFIEPLLILDTLDDIKEAISVVKSKKKGAEVSPEDMLIDMLMKLLSTSSNFLKKAVESIFKILVPLITTSSVDILIATLEADPKGNDDLLEDMEEEMVESDEEEEEEEEEENGEDELDADCFAEAASALPIKRSSNDSATEEEEPDVFLDDADAAELEMYDRKLAEIFSHKKAAKKSSKMTAQALLHFKSRALGLFKFILDTKSEVSLDVRLYALICLLKVIPFNLSEKNGSIAGSLGELIKTSCKKGPVESSELASEHFSEIFDLVQTTFWEKQILWSHAQCVLSYLLKIMGTNGELAPRLTAFWTALCVSKKMQKSNIIDFFSLWAETHAPSCWSLVESPDFFTGLESMNSHSRQLALKFLKKLISNKSSSQDHITEALVRNLLKLGLAMSSEADQRNTLRSAVLLLVAALKTRPGLINKNDCDLATLFERVDKDMKNLMNPLMK